MTTQQSRSETDIKHLLRTAATHYGESVTRYGHALTSYGSGKIDGAAVVETSINVAIHQVRQLAEVGVGLGIAYVKWSASLFGVSITAAESEASNKGTHKKGD